MLACNMRLGPEVENFFWAVFSRAQGFVCLPLAIIFAIFSIAILCRTRTVRAWGAWFLLWAAASALSLGLAVHGLEASPAYFETQAAAWNWEKTLGERVAAARTDGILAGAIDAAALLALGAAVAWRKGTAPAPVESETDGPDLRPPERRRVLVNVRRS